MEDEVEFRSTRLDSTRNTPLTALARAGAEAFGYTARLRIPRELAQLLRLRVAQLNGCPYCLTVHHAAARAARVPRAKVECLVSWWETELFTAPERAALTYAERLTSSHGSTAEQPFQAVHEAVAAHYAPEEVLEIAAVVINMNIWTRLKLAEGAMPTMAVEPAVPPLDDRVPTEVSEGGRADT
ncbi:carboxymuconolactone decarboxylase family protein [Auraticoccus monumenti]|uniref:Alkylhydroperoxidase AhpD family core domain-containing protein n=1 Tax=Auraticoccus monumenti TaxID=675864 RepID=A0A1G7BYV6_9ACTN|nr:carboxymuconolactone decarboxylase family protein [Auraticoccus monumenti]SDE32284.1 alkylhydroperoxidase AhpD family core domain-containing protein [Auraticoccus monumenti]